MKILVVSAHPDDLEISCSGTLKKLQDQGAEIISVITIAPSAENNPNRSKSIVESEMNNSYQLSDFKLKVFATPLQSNGRPDLRLNNVTMSSLENYLEPCDIAILPDPNDYHQDHSNTFHLSFPWLSKNAKEIWTAKLVPYAHYHKENSSNLFVDISSHWTFKKSLLKCYSSYLNDQRIENIEISNRFWGQKSNVSMAEAFTIVKKNA